MSSLKLTRSTRLTALVGSALAAGWLAVACGNNEDVPGNDTGGVSGSSTPNGGRAGANGGRAGASGGKAGASGEPGDAGAPDPGETGGGGGSTGGASAGRGGGGAAGMSSGAGNGGSVAGQGAGGAGAGGANAGQNAGGAGADGAHAGSSGAGAGTGGAGAGTGGAGAGTGGAIAGAGGAHAGSGGAGAGGGGASGAGAAGGGASGAGGTCGNGIKEGAEQCDDASAVSTVSTSPKCSNTCTSVSTQACVDCENIGDCFESVNNCLGVAAPFNATQQTQCYTVMSCIQKNNCFDGTGTLGKCYCGSLSLLDCGAAPFTGANSPNGACVAEIKAGFPTYTTNQQVLGGLSATNFPSGAAMSRLSCQKGANQSACLDICGFTAGGAAFP